MERHQHAVVQILSHLVAALGVSFSQTRASQNKRDGFGRVPLPLIALKKFRVSTKNNKSVLFNFGIFWGSFGHFYTLIEFSMHLCA